MSAGYRFPAGHVAVLDNTDLKEVLLLSLLHFQNLLFPFINKNMRIAQVEHYCGHLSFEGEIMFQNVPNLHFRVI